jgi:hypothetical protein
MRYRLSTVLILLGIAPPVIWLLAALAGSPRSSFPELNDPIMLIAALGWLALFTRFVLFRQVASRQGERPL